MKKYYTHFQIAQLRVNGVVGSAHTWNHTIFHAPCIFIS